MINQEGHRLGLHHEPTIDGSVQIGFVLPFGCQPDYGVAPWFCFNRLTAENYCLVLMIVGRTRRIQVVYNLSVTIVKSIEVWGPPLSAHV